MKGDVKGLTKKLLVLCALIGAVVVGQPAAVRAECYDINQCITDCDNTNSSCEIGCSGLAGEQFAVCIDACANAYTSCRNWCMANCSNGGGGDGCYENGWGCSSDNDCCDHTCDVGGTWECRNPF
jgi:hypothetical protein